MQSWNTLDDANRFAALGNVAAALHLLEPLITSAETDNASLPCGPKATGRRRLPSLTMLHNTGLKAFANAGDLEGARRWHTRMEKAHVRVNSKTYGKLMEASAKAGSLADTERWLICSCQCGFKLNQTQIDIAVDACARAFDPARAEAWLSRSRLIDSTNNFGHNASFAGFGAVVAAWARVRDHRRAELAASVALANASCAANSPALVETWSSLINACMRSGDFDRAERWLAVNASMSIRLDSFGYTSLLVRFAESGEITRAERWALAMLRDGYPLNPVSGSELIRACARRGESARASAWGRRFAAIGAALDEYGIAAGIRASFRAGDAECSEEWTKSLERSAIPVKGAARATLLEGHLRGGRLDRAEELLRAIVGSELPSTEAVFIVETLADAADLAIAERWYSQIVQKLGGGPHLQAHNAVIKACAKAGEAARSRCWLIRLKCYADGRSSPPPDEASYSFAMSAFARLADSLEVERLFHDMLDNGNSMPSASIFAIRMRPWAQAGDHKRVQEMWQEMLSISVEPEASNMVSMLESYGQARPPLKIAAARCYTEWVEAGGATDKSVLHALRRALGDRALVPSQQQSARGLLRAPPDDTEDEKG
eukprot:TRINITY_DN29618_c0_g1_i1.p1 TRINITY_DN29618_c0_g1~~TRINITY_DN29618_c0_g1_i1.p1  ORF type:complete len:677 (-),score=64.65 TRINITY_DN29618_c0_g1_i1:19-1830(-)